MSRRLRLVNALLGLVACLALWGVVETLTTEDGAPEQTAAASARGPARTGATGDRLAALRMPLPLLAEFDAILGKELFKSPPVEAAPPTQAVKPPPPPPPLPLLMGTVIVGEERKALIKEARDAGRPQMIALGESVAGGTLVEVALDHIIIERAGGRVEVPLKAAPPANPAATAGATTPTTPTAGGAETSATTTTITAPTQPQPDGPAAQAAEGGMTPEERLRRLREAFTLRRQRSGR